ncbi:MAG: YbjQ family protein [Christensenella sp.]|nr:YbjQ family protein [Christensenella sp.]
MLLVTSDTITGKTYTELGFVTGNTVQSVHIGKDFLAGFKTLVGGELDTYTEMMQEARKIATGRMVAEASSLGADAIISMRYASASITQGAAEIIAYGTAVKFTD